MKKKTIIVVVLSLILLYSCRKNFMEIDSVKSSTQFDVADAKLYLKALIKKDAEANKLARGIAPKTIKTGQKIFYPFWDRAITANYKGKADYVEVPIALANKQISLYHFAKDNIKEKPDGMVVLASFQRLVIYKNRKGQIGQRLLTYIPDKQYVRKHGYEASANSLSQLSRDFFGYIEFKNWSGDIVSVLRIENGKAVRRYKITKASKEQVLASQHMSVGTKGKVAAVGATMSFTEEEVCDMEWIPIYDTVCEVHDDGNPNDDVLNEVECTEEEVGEYAAWVCRTVEVPDPDPCPWGNCDECPSGDCGEEDPSPLIDCAGVVGGSAYDANCGCIGGTTGITECPPEDDCTKKAKIAATAANAKIAAENTEIKNKTSATGNEYGTEQNLQNPTANSDYKTMPVETDTQAGSFGPHFTWNSTDGYTIGVSHGHPGGSAPSPDDVFWMMGNLLEQELISSGASGINFYKQNASVTVVTPDGTKYAVTVKDWGALGAAFSTFNANRTAYDDDFATIANAHGSTEYALLSKLGSAITLFKAGPNSNDFKPLQINTNNQVSTKDCPGSNH